MAASREVRPLRMAVQRWRLVGVLATVVALGATAACTGSDGSRWNSPGSGSGSSRSGSSPLPEPPHLVFSPAADATDVSPADPVTVELTNGTLESVSLTNAQGKVVDGEFDSAQTTWTNAEKLGFDMEYTLTVVGVGADGQRLEQTHSFTTVKPDNYTLPYLRANSGDSRANNANQSLLDGNTYGVGQPIVVWFDEPIKDRAGAERSLVVTTDPPVEGAWRWMDNREVHWRPKAYWPSGTKVTVEANVYGKHFGGGLYGQEDRTASFTIGKSKIAVADAKTKRMKVYIDGKQVMKINGRDVSDGIPISMGKGGTEVGANGVVVDYWTRSGPHVVTLKYDVYRMTSASFGITDKDSPNYYDKEIKKSIRISGAGEFVHLRDWNTWQIGKYNTSHGCINVGVEYIYWFFDQFGAGDIVHVENTPKKLPLRDGLGDWTMSWEQWQKGSALD